MSSLVARFRSRRPAYTEQFGRWRPSELTYQLAKPDPDPVRARRAGLVTGFGVSGDRLANAKFVVPRISAEALTGLADMSSGHAEEQLKFTVGMVGARLTLGVLQIVD